MRACSFSAKRNCPLKELFEVWGPAHSQLFKTVLTFDFWVVPNIQYAASTLWQQFLLIFSVKSSLMKFWLRYLRLKTVDIFQKLILSSSFSLSIISINSSANSKIRDRFEICLSWEFQNNEDLNKISKLKSKAQFLKSQRKYEYNF